MGYKGRNFNEIESLIRKDNIEKRKAGKGIYNRASRKGYIRGGVKTASDFMTTKEKRQLNGKVIVRSMYEKIEDVPELEELLKKDEKSIVAALKIIRKNFTVNEAAQALKIDRNKLYSMYKEYNIPGKIKVSRTKLPGKYSVEELPEYQYVKMLPNKYVVRILKYCKLHITTQELSKRWNKAPNTISTMYGRYKISKPSEIKLEEVNIDDIMLEYKRRMGKVVEEVSEVKESNDEEKKLAYEEISLLKQQILQMENQIKKANEAPQGLCLTVNQVSVKQNIEDRLLAIAGVLNDDSEYEVQITIKEISKQ